MAQPHERLHLGEAVAHAVADGFEDAPRPTGSSDVQF